MIQNSTEYTVVREQLERAEQALWALRNEVHPKNERRFLVMAESYVEVILELRAQIDEYLGLSALAEFQTELVMGLEGPGVQLGSSPASLITRVLDSLRRGLQSIVEAANAAAPPERLSGRRSRWVEQICDLPLIGVASGSVEVRLGEPIMLAGNLLEKEDRIFYEQVMALLMDGIACAAGEVDAKKLPENLRQPVLNAVRKIVPTPRGVLDAITFSGRVVRKANGYRVTREARARIDQEIARVTETQTMTSIEGVIREVDLDENTFYLRDLTATERQLRCEYAETDEEDVKAFLDKRVLVTGSLRESPKTGRQTMEADLIEAVGVDGDLQGAVP